MKRAALRIDRTRKKVKPLKIDGQMTPSPGIEPGPQWWEASALTTAPSPTAPQPGRCFDREKLSDYRRSICFCMIFSKNFLAISEECPNDIRTIQITLRLVSFLTKQANDDVSDTDHSKIFASFQPVLVHCEEIEVNTKSLCIFRGCIPFVLFSFEFANERNVFGHS